MSPSPTVSVWKPGTTRRQRNTSRLSRPGPNSPVRASRSSAFSRPKISNDRSRIGTVCSVCSAREVCSHLLICSKASRCGGVSRVPGSATQASSGCHITFRRATGAASSAGTMTNRGR
jgi:hypothetical protein